MRKIQSKIKSPIALKKILTKKKNQKIVFTNGCFDLLHRGHVNYLEKAKSLGSILIVALDTDSSVRKLKGSGRPINSLKDRMFVIAGLESVDYVTWFDKSDPRSLIRLFKPKVLVKGGDWKPRQILGYEEVRSWGGKVKPISFVTGKSTTRMIQKASRATKKNKKDVR